jgi:hypothetical protein
MTLSCVFSVFLWQKKGTPVKTKDIFLFYSVEDSYNINCVQHTMEKRPETNLKAYPLGRDEWATYTIDLFIARCVQFIYILLVIVLLHCSRVRHNKSKNFGFVMCGR